MSKILNYRVVAGDTLFAIAKKFGMTVDALKKLNGLTNNNLKVGQVLKVQTSGGTPVTPSNPDVPSPSTGSYRVVAGDTLFGISKKFNMTVEELKQLNGLTSNNLSVGQLLRVRGGGSSPSPVDPHPPVDPEPAQPETPEESYLVARSRFEPEVVREADFKRYFMRVPVASGGTVLANMRDNITQSRFMVFPEGVMYGGQSQTALSLDTVSSVGLSLQEARALQYVSVHEGKFDAINSYDKAIFSYGFIQFAAAAAVGGSLNRLLANMEANAPGAFARVFKSVGIDTEGTGKTAVTTVLDRSGNRLRGDDAWRYIQRNIPIYGAFIQAGFEPALIKEQLRTANELYVQPALNAKIDVTVGGIRINIPRLRDILTSEAAITAVIALAVNQGLGGMSRIVGPSIERVGARSGLKNLSALSRIDEAAVLEDIAENSADDRVVNRVNGVLSEGLSTDKT